MHTSRHSHTFYLFCLLFLFPGLASADFAYDGLVVFGDSLSDAGNKFAVTGFSNTPPYDLLDPFLVPDGPYSRGGHHHTNGQTWVEQFAKPLELGDQVQPSERNPGVATNYAYGGARARDASATSPNRHLPEQLSTYLADSGGIASPGALHVIFIGGNDIAPDAVFAFASSPAVGLAIIGEAVGTIDGVIRTLYASGARKFLVMNSPDLGLTPSLAIASQLVDPRAAGLARCLSYWFNFGNNPQPVLCPDLGFNFEGLDDKLNAIEDDIPDPALEIIRYDVYSRFLEMVLEPRPGDPENGVDTCILPNYLVEDPLYPPFTCKRPADYVFWDGVHPTRTVHGIIADEVGMLMAD